MKLCDMFTWPIREGNDYFTAIKVVLRFPHPPFWDETNPHPRKFASFFGRHMERPQSSSIMANNESELVAYEALPAAYITPHK